MCFAFWRWKIISGNIFNVNELDAYSREILKIAQNEMPKETRKFLMQEGNKLRRATVKKAKSKTKKKTGNYYKGIKRGKIYIYRGNGGTSVRVYGKAPHTHLLEYGHVIKKKKRGPELGYAPGLHIFQESGKEFEPVLNKDVENFINKIVEGI